MKQQQLYRSLLRGKINYRAAPRYELILNILFCLGLLALVIIAYSATFDDSTRNDAIYIGLVGVITTSIFAMVLELRITRSELKSERDALEQRVIERTESLEAEQLRRTLEMQRFAEFGRISSQLLHDVANPLTVASLYLDQAEHRSSQAIREARRSLKHLEQYVQSARNQLQNTGEPRDFIVQKELRQLLLLLRPMAQKSQVKIQVCRSEQITLNGDPVRFHQIMANIIANAIDACKDSPKRHVIIQIQRRARYAQITVRDSGHGIAPLDLPRIFEPFFTTKQVSGHGLGIGLSTVRITLRDSYHGTICASSTPGDGTTFSMLFRIEPPLHTAFTVEQGQPVDPPATMFA